MLVGGGTGSAGVPPLPGAGAPPDPASGSGPTPVPGLGLTFGVEGAPPLPLVGSGELPLGGTVLLAVGPVVGPVVGPLGAVGALGAAVGCVGAPLSTGDGARPVFGAPAPPSSWESPFGEDSEQAQSALPRRLRVTAARRFRCVNGIG